MHETPKLINMEQQACNKRRFGITDTETVTEEQLQPLRRLYQKAMAEAENVMTSHGNSTRPRRCALADLFQILDNNIHENLQHLRELHLAAMEDDTLTSSDEEQRHLAVAERTCRRNALTPDDLQHFPATSLPLAASRSKGKIKSQGSTSKKNLSRNSGSNSGQNLNELAGTWTRRRRNAMANILEEVDPEWLVNREEFHANEVDNHLESYIYPQDRDPRLSHEECGIGKPHQVLAMSPRRQRRNAESDLLSTVEPGWLDNVRNLYCLRSQQGHGTERNSRSEITGRNSGSEMDSNSGDPNDSACSYTKKAKCCW